MNKDALIAELAKRHQLVINPKDPILIVYTMIEILNEDLKRERRNELDDFRSDIEEIYNRLELRSNETVQNFIDQNKEKIKQIIMEIIHQTEGTINEKINNFNIEFEKKIKESQVSLEAKIAIYGQVQILSCILILILSIILLVF